MRPEIRPPRDTSPKGRGIVVKLPATWLGIDALKGRFTMGREQFIGTSKLVSFEIILSYGQLIYPLGRDAVGRQHTTPAGTCHVSSPVLTVPPLAQVTSGVVLQNR